MRVFGQQEQLTLQRRVCDAGKKDDYQRLLSTSECAVYNVRTMYGHGHTDVYGGMRYLEAVKERVPGK